MLISSSRMRMSILFISPLSKFALGSQDSRNVNQSSMYIAFDSKDDFLSVFFIFILRTLKLIWLNI